MKKQKQKRVKNQKYPHKKRIIERKVIYFLNME
jgi:hypothetical protein